MDVTPIEADARGYYDTAGAAGTHAANTAGSFRADNYNVGDYAQDYSFGNRRMPISDFSGNEFSGGFGGPPTIAQSMNRYLNPYTKNVISDTRRTIRDSRDEALNNASAAASAAGAWGGSRHGVVDRGIYEDANRLQGEMANQMLNQRFNTAATLGGQDVGYGLQGSQLDINSRLAEAQHGLNIDTNRAASRQLGQRLGLETDIASASSGLQNAQLGLNTDMTRANIGQAGEAMNLAANQQLGGMAPILQDLATSGWNIGRTNMLDQMNAGNFTQGVNQQVIDAANNDYNAYMNQPYNMYQMLQQAINSNALGNETYNSSTSTSQLDQSSTGETNMQGSPSLANAWGNIRQGQAVANNAVTPPYQTPSVSTSGGSSGGGYDVGGVNYNPYTRSNYNTQTGPY